MAANVDGGGDVEVDADPDERDDEHDDEHDGEEERRERILDVICSYFAVTMERLLSYDRETEIVQARHCTMWLLHVRAGLGSVAIGEILRRDHSTAYHGIRMVERALKMEKDAACAVPHQMHALAMCARDVLDMVDGAWLPNEPPHMAFDPISIYWRKTWRKRAGDGWWKERQHEYGSTREAYRVAL